MNGSPTSKPRQQIPLWRKIATGIFLVLVIAGIGFTAYKISIRNQIASELDAIRKAGHPITIAELEAWYPTVPDEENAARFYEEAFRKYHDDDPHRFETLPLIGEGKFPPRDRSLSPELMHEIQSCLTANEAALTLLVKGATPKRCRYSLDLKKGFDCGVNLVAIRTGVRLLLLKAIYATECLKTREALESIDHAVRLSITLAHVPLMSGSMFGLRCLREAQDALERVMSRLSLPTDDMDGVIDTWKAARDSKLMQWVAASERCLGLSAFEDVLQNAQSANPGKGKVHRVLIWEEDKLEYLKLMKRVVRVGDETLPFSERAKEWDTALYEGERLSGCRLTKLLFPAAGWYLIAENMVLARLRAIQAAVAVERYRQAKGSLPAELEDIIPKFLDAHPQDPFNGGPLLYKKLAKGYVIYSVGKDGKNDGGMEPQEDEEPKDVTFTVER